MLDLGHLPPGFRGDVKIFNRPSTATDLQFMTWNKPRGCTMMLVRALSGGAGGGGGFTRAAGNAGGGGGGGGSSAIVFMLAPLIRVPDVLYIQVGAGGQGVGSGGGTAGAGTRSYITVYPFTDNSNILILCSGGTLPGGGGTGTGAAVGAAGAGGNIATSLVGFSGLGPWQSIAGQAGNAGGAVAGGAGVSATFPVTGVPTVGGAGGAGTTSADFAGGGITAITSSLISERRASTPAAGSNDGSSGLLMPQPFYSYPGLGGSSSNNGPGGAGGNGGPGSGGGGGGAGTTGGRGGNGGDGLVEVYCW